MVLRSRIWVTVLILLLILTFSSLGWAEENSPFTIDADWISYDSETGDFAAKGNVQANQADMFLQTDNLEGNMNSKDTRAYGNVFWQKGKDNLKGEEMLYNYNTQTGFLAKGEGCLENYHIKTDLLEKDYDKITLEHGHLTGCNGQTIKCYEVTARKLIIYPGKKLIAYDASFWIRGKKIFTLKKYTKSLIKQEDNSGLPKLGYSSSKGAGVKYKYNLSVGEDKGTSSFIALDYYAKLGTNLRYQAEKDTDKEKWTLVVGRDLDKDELHLESLPSLSWQQKPQEIKGTSLAYTLGLGAGHFYQEAKNASAWKTSANIGLANKPLPLWEQANLNLWTSYEKNWYSNNNQLGVLSYGAGINQGLGSRGNLEVSYIHREISGKTPFNFDDPGAANELRTGVDYQIDKYWRVGVSTSYDLDAKKYKDIDYTLTRQLHCFQTRIIWREKRDELNWSIDLAQF